MEIFEERWDPGSAARHPGAGTSRHGQEPLPKNDPAIPLDDSRESPYTSPAFMFYHGGVYQSRLSCSNEIQVVPNNHTNRNEEGKV
jgi:hypothetical protein